MTKRDSGLMKTIHYAWFICIGATLLMFCTSGLGSTAFAAYLPYLVSIKELANVQISLIVFIRSLFGVIGMFFVNALLYRFEIRRVVTAGVFICALAFVVFSLADGFAGYCAAAAVAGMAYGIGGMVPASILISRWFNEHRGLALGIVMASTGVSTFVAAPVITLLVEHVSLQSAFLIEAAFIAVCGAAIWLLVRSEPECLHTQPLGTDKVSSSETYANNTADRPLIFIMTFGWLILGAAVNNLHSHLSVLYQSVGFTSGQISTVISLFGISLAVGKCCCGQLTDRIGVFWACMILYVSSAAGVAICCMARNTGFTVACFGVILVGFGVAVGSVATSTYAVEAATAEDYPKIVSRFQTMQTLGGLAFATAPGYLADLTGDYIFSYVLMLILVVISAAILQGGYLVIRRRDLQTFE